MSTVQNTFIFRIFVNIAKRAILKKMDWKDCKASTWAVNYAKKWKVGLASLRQ